jgi:hypothetical protein
MIFWWLPFSSRSFLKHTLLDFWLCLFAFSESGNALTLSAFHLSWSRDFPPPFPVPFYSFTPLSTNNCF